MAQFSDEYNKSERNESLLQEMIEKSSQAPITSDASEVTQIVGEEIDSKLEKHHTKDFMRIFGGQSFSLVGSALVQFALVWWLTKTTGSVLVLVVATMMVMAPQILISPFAGPLVDRWNRRKVMIASDGLTALMVIVLAFLWWQGTANIIHIFTLMAVRSALTSFQWPALQASASMMVPKEHLSRINGMYQALQGLAKIAAPPLGALLLEILPMQWVLMIDVGTAAMAILPLLVIRIPQPVMEQSKDSMASSIITDMLEGFRYMKNWVGGRFITIALMVTNFILIPTFSLTPLLVLLHFAGGAIELAWMESMMGIGMVLGGVTLGIWGGFKRRMLTAAFALISAAIGIFVIGLTPPTMLILAIVGIFLTGFMIPMASGSLMAVVQSVVPHKMQGRIFTVLMSLGPAMAPFGLALAGVLVEMLGMQSWFLLGGIGLALVGIIGSFVPTLARLGEIESE
ncbi:MAG: MFS transporter [Candidatus Thorarchaeota archaeon]|jgi:DHA3 family macrolide efflux protein-like MFS transporter